MGFFSKLSKSLFADAPSSASSQAQDLSSIVDEDRKLVEGETLLTQSAQPVTPIAPTINTPATIPSPTHARRGQSSLSPFASKILEKAKIESLKSDDERQKLTSPSQLFATDEAVKRVEHLESIALERSKMAANKFLHGARTIPNTNFLQKNGLVHK